MAKTLAPAEGKGSQKSQIANYKSQITGYPRSEGV
jgi:hypothetical protein